MIWLLFRTTYCSHTLYASHWKSFYFFFVAAFDEKDKKKTLICIIIMFLVGTWRYLDTYTYMMLKLEETYIQVARGHNHTFYFIV